MSTSPAPVEAIDRALLLLERLADAGPTGAQLADLTALLGLNKSTAYRALSTLRGRGYAVQDPDSGRYSLGPAALRLSGAYFGEENLPALLHPALTELSRTVHELVHLGVPAGSQVLYVDKVEPELALRVWSRIGQTVPAATTALGRALLAFRGTTRDQLEVYVRGAREVLAGRDLPPVDADALWQKLEASHTRGYATEIKENEPGIACIGVPLLRAAPDAGPSTAIAALSITAPAERMSTRRIAQLYGEIQRVVPPLLPEGLRLP